jgi:hypothetical protein
MRPTSIFFLQNVRKRDTFFANFVIICVDAIVLSPHANDFEKIARMQISEENAQKIKTLPHP